MNNKSKFACEYPLKLLVAEDNLINCKVIERILSHLGYKCEIVHDGQEAFERIRDTNGIGDSSSDSIDGEKKKPYELLATDLSMPKLGGIEATRMIRGLGDVIYQPQIIALTANVLEQERDAAIRSGMNAFLHKPIAVDKLQVALQTAYLKIKQNNSN